MAVAAPVEAQSGAAALLELAAASARAWLVAPDGGRCRSRRKGRNEVPPPLLSPALLAFAFSSLLFGLPAFGGFLPFENLGVPQRFPLGELLRGDGFPRTLAPDFIIFLHPALRALPGRSHLLGRDALPAPVCFVLLAPSFLPLGFCEIEFGTAALDSVDGTFDAVAALGPGDFGRDVHEASLSSGSQAAKGVRRSRLSTGDSRKYCRVPMDDDHRVENVFDLLRDAVNFICRDTVEWRDEVSCLALIVAMAYNRGDPVLVYSDRGLSRSAAVIVAFISFQMRMSARVSR